jgi:hypothetical protein
MLLGSGAFVATYPRLKPLITRGGIGKARLPALTRTAPWRWVAAIASSFGAILATARLGHGRRIQPSPATGWPKRLAEPTLLRAPAPPGQ